MSYISGIIDWIKKNPLEFWVLLSILAIGAFFRLYKIDQYMTFLGDEGRDVIIVRRLLTEGHPPLIGPGTSIGNMYLGPFYYYMMAPVLLLANFSPLGPAIQIALLGIITIWFVWYVFRSWFPSPKGAALNVGALVSAGLYAISPTIIIYSRSSWNPNIMPFFALLSIFSIWKVWKEQKYNWLLVLGFSFAGVIQSHYLGLLLVPTIGILWILTYLKSKNFKFNSEFVKKSLMGYGILILLMSPLFFFDLRHDWINSRAMYQFFTVRQTTVSIKPWTAIPKIPEMLDQINTSLIGARNFQVGAFVSVLMTILVIWFVWNMYKGKNCSFISPEFFILLSWYLFGLIGFGIYKQNIYDHYFGFLFAVPCLIVGVLVSKLFSYKLIGKIISFLLVLYLVVINLMQSPLMQSPNNQLKRASEVARKIQTEAGGTKFNLGVIAERNYEDGYKYFLLKNNQPVVSIDSQIKDSITDQLFVVCELDKVKCDPTHNANAAVANFGWSKIDKSWEIDGVILYRLVHSQK